METIAQQSIRALNMTSNAIDRAMTEGSVDAVQTVEAYTLNTEMFKLNLQGLSGQVLIDRYSQVASQDLFITGIK